MFQRDMNPLSVGTHRIKIQNDPTVLLIWCFCRWCVPTHKNLFSNHLIPSLAKRCYKHVHYTSDGLCKTKRTKLPLKITVFVLVYGWVYCSGYLQSELQDHIKYLSWLLVHTHALPTQENITTQSKCISEHINGASYLCVKPKLNLN